jgi:hypothetical protein
MSIERKITKRQGEAFQKAHRLLNRDRILWDKEFKLYGFGDDKKRLERDALKNYMMVQINKTPKIMHTVDPDTAKYVAYVHGRKVKK